jgi:2'-5' RNA ligase
MSVRTFVAVDIKDDVRRRLVAGCQGIRRHPGAINWVQPEIMHVTLNFLDRIEESRMNDVRAIVSEVAGQAKCFDFQVRGLTVAPPKGRARTVWAEVVEPSGELARLQERLAAAFGRIGVPREHREYRPHVTLARVKFTPATKGLRADAEAMAQEDFGTVHVSEVILFTSDLRPEGPSHTPVARAPLGG